MFSPSRSACSEVGMIDRYGTTAGGRVRRWSERRRKGRGDRGASMVEFAIVAPLLFLMLFGIIDFGWLLNQQQDVRYGAREGARIAATTSPVSPLAGVDGPTTTKNIVNAICERMDSADSGMRVSLQTTPSTGADVGDLATIQVWKPARDITGFFTDVIGDSVIKSELSFRLEQQRAWSNTGTMTDANWTTTGMSCTGP